MAAAAPVAVVATPAASAAPLASANHVNLMGVPAVLHRHLDGEWRWLPQTTREAPDGRSLMVAVYCPSQPALHWALPWGALPGPLTVEEEQAQADMQAQRHREMEVELGLEVTGYASHLLGELRRESNFLELVELPQSVSSKVWEGALLLREAALARGNWTGTKVLELGAGVGLVGLSLAVEGADVVLTDLGEAMPVLESNTERNADIISTSGGRAQAVELDWLWDEGRQRDAVPLDRADIVLGADVVYTLDASAGLLRTFLRFGSELWLVQNIHRAATTEFLAAAASAGLVAQREQIVGAFNYELWRFTLASASPSCTLDDASAYSA